MSKSSPALQSWGDFHANLTSMINELGDGEFLIVEPPEGWRYLQFANNDGILRGEVQSNEYTAETEFELTEQQDMALAGFGWELPNETAEAVDAGIGIGSPNYSRDFRPGEGTKAAMACVGVYKEVLGMTDPSKLKVTTHRSQVSPNARRSIERPGEVQPIPPSEPHDRLIYFESDFDGDRCAIARTTPKEAAEWHVTYIDEYGVRSPAKFDVAMIFYKQDTRGRPAWYADSSPGTELEFRLPDGTEITVSASRNLGTPITQKKTLSHSDVFAIMFTALRHPYRHEWATRVAYAAERLGNGTDSAVAIERCYRAFREIDPSAGASEVRILEGQIRDAARTLSDSRDRFYSWSELEVHGASRTLPSPPRESNC